MSDPIKDYAKRVAEAVIDHVMEEGRVPAGYADLDAIIASVPRPVMQHHAAPTCVGWWWARRKGKWEAVRVTGWGAGSQDRHVAMVERAGSFTGAVCDAWVGPLLPPDTTEPAPKLETQDLLRQMRAATPTPDIDPEEVRRALDEVYVADTNMVALTAAAREYLRLREQSAPQERTCTCTGTCKGQEGLAPGWRCALSQPAPDVQAQERWDAIIREREALAEEVRQMVAAVEQMADVQAQIDATDDVVCPRHGCAVCEECAIDAAVAREREEILDSIEVQIVKDIAPGWVSIPAVEWEAIRARSAKGSE